MIHLFHLIILMIVNCNYDVGDNHNNDDDNDGSVFDYNKSN